MPNPNVDDYLQQGIHGAKEIKPEERKKFLGTLRERVIIALNQSQVIEKTPYKEVEEAIKSSTGAKVYLNGHLDYSYLSKYIKIANQYNMEYTIVNNKDYDSEIGLLVAYDHAIEKEDIYVTKEEESVLDTNKADKKGFFTSIGNLFKK